LKRGSFHYLSFVTFKNENRK